MFLPHSTSGLIKQWIGVDLDGCLAEFHGWVSPEHIGLPLQPMLDRVKAWLAAGHEVRIFTARVGPHAATYDDGTPIDPDFIPRAHAAIEAWCFQHIGQVLPVTATKDFGMVVLYDDRAIQVEANTGHLLYPEPVLT